MPGLPLFGHYARGRARLGGLWKKGKGQNHPALALPDVSDDFQLSAGTLLYDLKSDVAQVEQMLWFLAEGGAISVLVRDTGWHEATVTRWLERSGGVKVPDGTTAYFRA